MYSATLVPFVFTSLLVAPSLGVTLTQWTQLTEFTYDYIIIGGEFGYRT